MACQDHETVRCTCGNFVHLCTCPGVDHGVRVVNGCTRCHLPGRVLAPGEEVESAQPSTETIPQQMAFSIAIAVSALKNGGRVTRQVWPEGTFLSLHHPKSVSIGSDLAGYADSQFMPYILLRTASGHFVPWTASHEDLLSHDWIVLNLGRKSSAQ